jgi:hypothetical protein
VLSCRETEFELADSANFTYINFAAAFQVITYLPRITQQRLAFGG